MSVLAVVSAPTDFQLLAAGYELGVGRAVPSTAAVLGLISVLAGSSLVRARRIAARRIRLAGALGLGPIAVVVGGLHGANAAGGLGTGNGLAGAVIAVALGLIGILLGVLALARSSKSIKPI
ncbi:DUF6223 family protein [Nocardia inohanensis]|uniref:DUF6223 family protein n=1 Tax=Nocardia inohanensis TaxID=209246 RepID=UPI00082D90F8|nr:DUF6223 family protein [Nocardia inohanensis]